MTVALPLVTALAAGFTHALEADHMAAVTTFVSKRPHPLRALGFGVRWAVGHSVALAVATAVLLALDLHPPEAVSRALEAGVGVMLAALGVWLLAGLWWPRPPAHDHDHASLWVGFAHGLAGTGAFLALIPVAIAASPLVAGGYVLAFGLGTIVAMGLWALLAGVLFDRVGGRAPIVATGLRGLTATASIAIGLLWVLRATT